jgi:Spy/CpxP family protein refolding chaperone
MCAALLFAAAPVRAASDCDWLEQRPAAKSDQKGTDKAQSGQSGRQGPKKWWIEAESRAELGITDQQSAQLEEVWQRSLTKRAETRDRLEKAETILNKLVLEAADEAAVIAQLDKVEATRSEANKARVLLLYRMNRVLTPEQRAKVDAKVKAMRERDGRRGGPR